MRVITRLGRTSAHDIKVRNMQPPQSNRQAWILFHHRALPGCAADADQALRVCLRNSDKAFYGSFDGGDR
jgi:hypothetical protein